MNAHPVRLPNTLVHHARELLLLLAVVVLVTVGFLLGRGSVDPLHGIAYVTLASADTEVLTAQPTVAIALDAGVLRRHDAGYEVRPISGAERDRLAALLTHGPEWASTYPMAGTLPEPRARLVLGAAPERAVLLDAPTANPTVPESLQRLVVELQQIAYDAGAFSPLEPTIVRVRARDASGTSTDAVRPAPAWLDVSAAQSDAGQRMALAELPPTDRALLGSHGEQRLAAGGPVRLADGRVVALDWSLDWATWAGRA